MTESKVYHSVVEDNGNGKQSTQDIEWDCIVQVVNYVLL